MKKNPGRKERRRLLRHNSKAAGKKLAKIHELKQKKDAKAKKKLHI